MASNLRSKDAHLRGTAVNIQGNKTAELARSAPAVYRKLDVKPSAKEWYTKKQGLEWPVMCVAKNCKNLATDGAHVFLVEREPHEVFIVGTCHACNVNRKVFEYIGTPALLCELTQTQLEALQDAHKVALETGACREKTDRPMQTRSKTKAAAKAEAVKRASARDDKAAAVADEPAEKPAAAAPKVLCGAPTVSSGGKRTCKIARASCWHAAHKEWHKENDK